MSYVIACSNIKGGTAKTSSVTSLAGIFAQQHYRVLVIDCDPQSNLTIALGLNPDKLDKTLVEVISNEEMCFSEAIVPITEGFDLVPAHMALHALELRMVSNVFKGKATPAEVARSQGKLPCYFARLLAKYKQADYQRSDGSRWDSYPSTG